MRDLPYRWIEAIQDRRDYIEDQLRLGSPVVGLPYAQGSLLLTVTKGHRKYLKFMTESPFPQSDTPQT